MKNEWSYIPCQLDHTVNYSSVQPHPGPGIAVAGRDSVLVSGPVVMGHQQPSHQAATMSNTSTAQYTDYHQPASNHHYMGGQHPLRCNCAPIQLPDERTILHGILTGRGYKFGYGTAFEPRFFSPLHGTYTDQEDSFLQLQPIDTKVPSPEMISPSRYISQQQAK